MQANLLLINGNIYTMDAQLPQAEAIAICEDKIVAVGSTRTMQGLLAPNGQTVDLAGRTVLPGFIDAHLHFLSYGLSLQEIDLVGTSTLDMALERVAKRVAITTPSHWLTGRGWDQSTWAGGQFPTRHDLDKVASKHPVYLRRKCGHAGWANSEALRLAHITAETPDPPGGEIERDPSDGQPTGLLKERAMDLVASLLEEPSDHEAVDAVRAAMSTVHRMGIVGVHNMEAAPALQAFQYLHRHGELKLRVLQQIPVTELDAAIQLGLQTGFGDNWLRIGALKIFADGALGARTAQMIEPYEGEPDNYGIAVTTAKQLNDLVERAAQAGLAVHIHAIGDKANRNVLDAIELTRQAGIGLDLRHRIEHAQILHPDDMARFVELGVIPSMQPIHCTQDMILADQNWGKRSRGAYAWSSLLSSGAVLAFGSDAPVETPDVLQGIYAAVTRRRADGYPSPEGWYPEECLTVEESIYAYTVGAAYASGEEMLKGSLSSGKLADLVILSQDILASEPDAILQTDVLATMVGGEFVYEDGAVF